MHTHFCGFPRKIFYSVKRPPHLFGIAKPNDTLFHRKNEKIFFGCGCFILLAPKTPFTYSHWEKPNAHPKSQKIFYPFTHLELRSRNAPCFYKNFEKYFLIEGLDSACSKSPFTYSHWERAFGDSNTEKRQKNMPTGFGGHLYVYRK